jgi:NAD(P)-dependent dehydrogenase (short-subunit alcohol dehydrogenase family)
MGRAIALALAREGADVALGARNEDKLQTVAAEVEALGRRAVWRPTNIARDEDCLALAQTAAEAFGGIDVLVNNAFAHPPFRTIEDAPTDDWNLVHKVNVVGSLQMTKAVLPHMKGRDGANLVFVSSMSARTGEPNAGAYAASKAAMLSVVKTLARELGPRGIRVNACVPGYIWGPSLEGYFNHLATERGCDPQEVYDEIAQQTALRHIPSSEEIADTVVFLASPWARAVTGQALDVNAGHWMD